MSSYKLPETDSLDEDRMVNMKGITNLLGPVIILSFVIYGGALFFKVDGPKLVPELLKKTLAIFGLGA
jgi:hypothetical protein